MQLAKENVSAENMREMQAGLDRLERREWWRWATALLIMLLLTFGVFSLSVPEVRREAFTGIQLDVAVRGLFAIVVVFDVFVIYQQILISRLRRQLSGQIGMLAALEALRPAAAGGHAGRKERRRSPRYPFDQRLKARAAVQGKESVLYGRVIDISDFGLGAVLSGSLERGDKVVLEFAAGAGNPILTLPAVIRYAQGFRYGFEFSGLSSVEAEHIKRACRSAGVTTTAQGRAGVLQATLSSE
jgi:PilZ domain